MRRPGPDDFPARRGQARPGDDSMSLGRGDTRCPTRSRSPHGGAKHRRGPIVRPANARILGARIPDATVHVVADAGHLLLMDPGRPLR